MKYISLFSGIGGLESPAQHPILACESDKICQFVLQRRFPEAEIHGNVVSLKPPPADVVVGGWPCQDISAAGLQLGLEGLRSGLFFQMLRIAGECNAHTIVAENVPNLLAMRKGAVFRQVLNAFHSHGFKTVAWRTLNAREFGLPHERRRVFLIASKHPDLPLALHRGISATDKKRIPAKRGNASFCNAFYWTAGLQSICYSQGFVPTLKVGSSLSIPSPPAIHFEGCVRKATAYECLALQGFPLDAFSDVHDKDIYRMSGNAVAVPAGQFAMSSLEHKEIVKPLRKSLWLIGPSGVFHDETICEVDHPEVSLSTNLDRYVDLNNKENFSKRAAAGLLKRLKQSAKPCPKPLWEILHEIAESNQSNSASEENGEAYSSHLRDDSTDTARQLEF